MKDSVVYYCVDCSERCIDLHKPQKGKRHNQISMKRFKNKIDEYLSQDDWLWEQALGIEYKLQELQKKIKALKEQMMEKVYQKKLAYALNWDTAHQIVKSLKLARDGDFAKLTCANAFRVYEKVDRDRKINEKDVKRLARQIIDDTKIAVQTIVQQWVKQSQPIKGRYEKQEERPRARQERDRQERKPRQDSVQQKYKPQTIKFGNDYPTVKINEVESIDTHFNIILKVMRVHKQFKMGPISKIEFTGGDSTGTATVVVDSSRIIRVGAVISIQNARIYLFHQSIKQIQQSNRNSTVKEERVIINDVNERLNISQRKGRKEGGYRGRGRNERTREDRYQRQQRVQRVDRSQRSQRPQKSQIGRGERRQYRRPRDNRYSQDSQRQNENKEKIIQSEEEEKRPSRKVQQKSKVVEKPKPQERSQRRKNSSQSQQSQSSQSDEDEIKVEQESKVLNKSQVATYPNITKIKDIGPGDQDLTILAQIVQIIKGDLRQIKPQKGHLYCTLGDQTAVIRAELPRHSEAVKEGVVIKVNNINSVVDTDHRITLKLGEQAICERTNIKIHKINLSLNQSEQKWQSEQEDEEQGEQQQNKKAIIEDF